MQGTGRNWWLTWSPNLRESRVQPRVWMNIEPNLGRNYSRCFRNIDDNHPFHLPLAWLAIHTMSRPSIQVGYWFAWLHVQDITNAIFISPCWLFIDNWCDRIIWMWDMRSTKDYLGKHPTRGRACHQRVYSNVCPSTFLGQIIVDWRLGNAMLVIGFIMPSSVK